MLLKTNDLLTSNFISLLKRIFVIAIFCVAFGQVIQAAPTTIVVQTIVPSTSITVNAFVTSQPLYETTSGNMFTVVEETSDFYLVLLPKGEKGWVKKTDVKEVAVSANAVPTPSLTKIEPKIAPQAPVQPVLPPYRFSGQENYRYPIPPKKTNLDLDVNGYYEVKVSARDFSPKNPSDPRYDIIIRDPIYNKIPADVLVGPLKTEFKLNVQIDGKLDENLSVHYDIQQEPNMPDKYDVKIQYKNKELQFYNFDAEYINGDFIKIKKGLNGAQYKQSDTQSDFRISTGRQRSDPKTFSTYGTGQTKYNLGNTSVLEGSVSVWRNNRILKEGSDYKVNYYEGTIEFASAPQKTDYIQAVYEFTNPIEDFLPVLSRKNFLGVQYLWKSQTKVSKVKQNANSKEWIWKPVSPSVTVTPLSSKNTPSLPSPNVITPSSTTPTGTVQATVSGSVLEAALSPTLSADIANAIKEMMVEGIDTSTEELDTTPLIQTETETLPTKNETPGPSQVYYLKYTPIILGSDEVLVNDRELIRNTDYFIDHSSGKLSFVNPITSRDAVSIDYDYYLSKKYEEDLIGRDSPGPYTLKNSYPIDGTIDVYLNDRLLLETKDYIVDYDSGQIFFNYKIDYPKVITAKYRAIASKTVTENAIKQPFSFGFTYANEYSKSQEEELTIKVVSENVAVSKNVIYLANTPLINTENLNIIISGQRLTSHNYVISAYKGQITLNDYSSGTAVVSYDYRKSHPTRTTFVGSGLQDYIAGQDTFVIRDLPMKYKGIRQIMIWRATGGTAILIPGNDYEIDFGEDGYEIKLKFKKKSDTTYSSQLDRFPDETDTISIDYDFTSPTSTDPGNIDQKMIGFTGGASITDRFRVDGELVAANHNFSKPQVELEDPVQIKGTGKDYEVYNLGKANLVENSETVFIGNTSDASIPTQNRIYRNLQTKDKDYIINYTQGTIKFRNKTPGKNDTIIVFFKYYDLSGVTQVGEEKNYKLATKLSTTYQSDIIKNQSYFKYIDKDFLPISPIQDTKGTMVFGNEFSWRIDPNSSFGFNYKRTQQDRGAKDDSSRYYLNSDDFNTQLKARWFDLVDTDSNFRYSFNLEDPKDSTSLVNKHGTDTLTYGWDTAALFGPKNMKFTAKKAYSKQIDDYIDQDNPLVTDIFSHHYSLAYTSDSVPILKKVTVKPIYENSRELRTSNFAPTESITYRQNYGFSSDFQPFNSLKGTAQYSIQNLSIKPSSTSPKELSNIYNNQYSLTYSPASWFQAKWDLNHNENESPLNAQKGSISDSQTYSISRFSPYGALTAVGVKHLNPFILPFKDTFLTYNKKDDSLSENNNKKQTDRNNHTYSLNAFTPIPGLSLNNYTFTEQNTSLVNNVQTQTASGNTSFRLFKRENATISIAPKWPVFRLFSYSYQIDDSNDNQTDTTYAPTRNLIEQKHPIKKESQKLSLNPISLTVPLPFGWKLPLGSFSASMQGSRDDRTNTTITSLISALTGETVATPSRQEDSFYDRTFVYEVALSPFNLFNLKGTLTSSNTTIRRNLNSDKGSTFKEGRNYNISGDWAPFRWLTFTGTYTQDRNTQFTSPSLNASKSAVAFAMNENNSSVFESYLNKLSRIKTLQSVFTPFSFISLKGGASFTNIDQINKQKTADSLSNTIEQRTGIAGLTLRPLKDLSIGYDYRINQTKDSSTNKNSYAIGRNGITTITYSPIKTKSFDVNISYNRTDSWGSNLNTLDNQNLQAGTGQIGATTIVDTNSTEELASLLININIPVPSSPFLQSFQISGEGYVKRITDRKDGTRASGVKNSFNLGGIVIKGTLLF